MLLLRESSVCSPDACGKIYQILLLHKPRKRDAWQLPQGGVEFGETIEQAALRELQEEAGIGDVNILGRCNEVYEYDFPASYRRFRPDHVCGQRISCVVALLQGDPQIHVDNKEIDNHAWVYPEELSRYVRRRKYLSFVQRLLKEVQELAIRLAPPSGEELAHGKRRRELPKEPNDSERTSEAK